MARSIHFVYIFHQTLTRFISMASRNESEDPAMPLKLKWRKKKAKEGDGDSAVLPAGRPIAVRKVGRAGSQPM